MSRIAILSPCVEMADAVSNDAIGMYRALAAQGHEVALFANTWNISEPDVRHVRRMKQFLKGSADLLIYHHSVGWDTGLYILKEVPCKRIIKYHNVTPSAFYDNISTDFTNACRAGRDQLKVIAQAACDLYLSDSEYNMQELLFEGAKKANSQAVPPFHHIDRLHFLEAELAILDAYRDGTTNLLTVGRVAPNKGHALLIDAFATYHYGYDRKSRLLIVGKEDERLRVYTETLRDQVARLGLQDAVVFTGEVSDSALKAYYLLADVFMMTSAHEGFCVPLVEAMAMKLPIVAHGSSAIPGTVGRTGLVWEEPDPELLAESVHIIREDEGVGVALGLMGWLRYQQLFTNEKIGEKFLTALDGLVCIK